MNLKEIKKPSGKSLRVWAKNQLRFAIFEKILKFTYKNLTGKLIFYPFSLPSSRTFVILYTSATYQNLCGSGRGVVLLRAWGGTFEFGGSGVLYKSLRFMLFQNRNIQWRPLGNIPPKPKKSYQNCNIFASCIKRKVSQKTG